MTTIDTLELTKKYGTKGLLIIALLWMNNRLNTVEERLYLCYNERRVSKVSEDINLAPSPYYAVLPKEVKIKKENV